MIIILFFGLLAIIIILAFCCIGACILCCLKSASNPTDNEHANKLKAYVYDPAKYKTSESCCICMEEYQKGDKITTLACNDKHYFHNQCI
jgi:hypothetical protein